MPLFLGVGVIPARPSYVRVVAWASCYDDGRPGPQPTEVLPRRPATYPIGLATICAVRVLLTNLDLPDWATVLALIGLIALVALAAWLLVRFGAERVARGLLRGAPADPADPTALLNQIELERRVRTVQRLAVQSAGGVIGLVAVLMALDTLGLNIGPAIAGLGVAGIAVGLGAQSLVHDWLAGIFIVLENQFSQGDVVRIAGVSGVVEEFSLRRTTLRDLDGTVHTVPNGQIVVASNLTRTWARVNLDIPVVYGTDIDDASAVINEVGALLLDDPEWGARLLEAPRVVRVNALDDLGVTLKVLGQVRAAEQWSVAGELRKRILAAFAARGIRIPTSRLVMGGTPGDPPVPSPDDPPRT
jgi:moderate conductance mechanosensitive channel